MKPAFQRLHINYLQIKYQQITFILTQVNMLFSLNIFNNGDLDLICPK